MIVVVAVPEHRNITQRAIIIIESGSCVVVALLGYACRYFARTVELAH